MQFVKRLFVNSHSRNSISKNRAKVANKNDICKYLRIFLLVNCQFVSFGRRNHPKFPLAHVLSLIKRN